jgi:spore coat protein CotH
MVMKRRLFEILAVLVVCGLAVAAASLIFSGCGAASAATEPGTASTGGIEATQSSAAAAPVTSSSTASSSAAEDLAGSQLFDTTIVREVSISLAPEDYDAMIETYQSTGEKDWIKATVTIDGTSYADVGVRLKGNSSLRRVGNNRGQTSASWANDPQALPWLIRFDKYVEGQNCDGVYDLVVRSNTSQTSLNEAVALDLLALAGLSSERAVPVSFVVNGSAAKLRLATELPDDLWMIQHFGATGSLYKAEASGDYSYRGTDPDAYAEAFDEEAGKDSSDLTPLIEFLDFINNSDDAIFNAELAERLDVDSFATYLAMEELVSNFDDIDGPGNNSYLYYDPATGRFTVVPWDHNLAFGSIGRGQNRVGAAAGEQTQGLATARAIAQPTEPGNNATANGNAVRAPRGKSNIIVQRFHANPDFEALYQQKLAQLKQSLYQSGVAEQVLAKRVSVLETQGSGLVDSATIQTEAAKIAAYFSTS